MSNGFLVRDLRTEDRGQKSGVRSQNTEGGRCANAKCGREKAYKFVRLSNDYYRLVFSFFAAP
jgi:hypothetical protein